MVDSNQIGRNQMGDQGWKLDRERMVEKAYKEFYETLYRLGVTEDILPPIDNMLRTLRSRGVAASSQSATEDKGQSGCSLFISVQLLTYKQIVQRICLHLGRVLSLG